MTDAQFATWLTERGASEMGWFVRSYRINGIEQTIEITNDHAILAICRLLVEDGAMTNDEIPLYRNFRRKLGALLRDLELIGDDEYQPSKPFNLTGSKGKPEWGRGWRK